jgi:stage II sporulation protein D
MAIFVLLSFSEAQSATPTTFVRVKLFSSANAKIQIHGYGLQFQGLNQSFQKVAIPQNDFSEIEIINHNGKKAWAYKQSAMPFQKIITDRYFYLTGDNVIINGHNVPAKILLSENKNHIDVIGVVPLEDYLVGVLAGEMPLTWPEETLKAQAVVARSYTLAVINERKDKPYHVESSVMDQSFRHLLKNEKQDVLVKKAQAAVEATKDIKLLNKKTGRVLKAFYHADCGGQTTTAKNVWNTTGDDSGVTVDRSCPSSPKSHWHLEITAAQLKEKLHKDVRALEVVQEKNAPRILQVKLQLENNQTEILPANEFRKLLGFQELKSTMFTLQKNGDSYLFEGRGFGHGVGLCQWGSRALAKSGSNFKQILMHYYPLAGLETSTMLR